MSVPSLRLRVNIYIISQLLFRNFFFGENEDSLFKNNNFMIKIGPEAGYVTFCCFVRDFSKVDSPPPIQSIAAPTIPTFPPIAFVIHSGRTQCRACTHRQ